MCNQVWKSFYYGNYFGLFSVFTGRFCVQKYRAFSTNTNSWNRPKYRKSIPIFKPSEFVSDGFFILKLQSKGGLSWL